MADSSLDLIDHTYRLLYYSSKGDTTALKCILEKGATPDAADYDYRTALHLAASEGHSSVVEFLLEYKANVNPVDRWNRTPLADARRYKFEKICEILEAHGGVEEVERLHNNSERDPLIQKESGPVNRSTSQRQREGLVDYTYNLLYCASKGDVFGLSKVLLQGASPDSADYDQRTALHLASSEGHIKVVEILLAYKACINPKDRWGRTPLSDATKYKFRDICRLLEANGGIIGDHSDSSPIEDLELDPAELIEDKEGIVEEGSFGEVRTVFWRGTKVAVKTIKASLNADSQIQKEFQKEVSIWKHLRHPNIVQFLGAVTRDNQLAIVTEYLQKGDLDKLMTKGPLDAKAAIKFALDIARGMNYLHEHRPKNLVHRDLTPKNLLMDDAGHLKVADFGLSKLLEASSKNIFETYNMTGVTGSLRYMAPEVYRGEQYDKSVDVFSFAIIVAEMFEGRDSWQVQNEQWVAGKRAHENARPFLTAATYPKGLKELLYSCWDDAPLQRPTFANIIPCLEDFQKALNKPKKSKCFCFCM